MTKPRDEDSLAPTWAVIEAKRPLPVTIAVIGATDRDNTVAVAHHLACSAVQAGHLTACFSTSLERGSHGYDVLSLPLAVGTEAYSERARFWRATYQVLIVEAPSVLATALGVHIARSADGVIVALCNDRRILDEDRQVGTFLEQLGVKALGVVRTGPATRSREVPVARLSLKEMGRTLRSLVFRT